MQCDLSFKERRQSLFSTVSCTAVPVKGKHMCAITVNDKHVTALLDSGSLVTLIKAELIDSVNFRAKKVAVVCVHGDTREYPIVAVKFGTARGDLRHLVGVVPHLVHDVIIGRDFPEFWELWEHPDCATVSKPETESEYMDAAEQLYSEDPSWGSPDFPFSVLAGELEESEGPIANEDRPPSVETEATLEFADLNTHRENFGSEQRKDPTLVRAWENVMMINGEPVDPGNRLSFPYFISNDDMLYRVYKKNNEIIEQLVVPKPYKKVVLELAHGHLLGGHLGTEKTTERVLQRFYWPGVQKDIENYCKSCPVCQMSAPLPHFRSPLVPLPIIEVPFERIAMDLVGPLPKSARGHQYILVIMDYATRYPEAIPLRQTSAKNIAKELLQVFSRVGIPKDLLTDQGTPFMSRVTKELCKLFKVTHLRTSVYHPQTDGLVERFNKTLKSMLKKVVDKDGKNWDYLLPYLMFAIREVPQSSTGYSPFELLYGRHPRGLLDIAKETWEGEKTPHKSIIEHISQMQDRITVVMPIVKEHLAQSQAAQQRIYNRDARV
uniref:Gypsy retrotransposon integrase-like protein 1 n=1 Tax=Leptobrachium leishanense TaxID=445787 RepID=A0A8C5LTZ1_9ANUR